MNAICTVDAYSGAALGGRAPHAERRLIGGCVVSARAGGLVALRCRRGPLSRTRCTLTPEKPLGRRSSYASAFPTQRGSVTVRARFASRELGSGPPSFAPSVVQSLHLPSREVRTLTSEPGPDVQLRPIIRN